jgi:hypothetical protein
VDDKTKEYIKLGRINFICSTLKKQVGQNRITNTRDIPKFSIRNLGRLPKGDE